MAGKITTQLVIEGKNNSRAAFDEVNNSLSGMNKQLASAGKALVAAFSLSALTGAVRGIADAADSYNLMNARLKLATGSQEEFNKAQTELRRIASATQTPLESLAALYGRISRPLKEAGRSQADILKVTEAVATAFRVSGASAQEAENGVIQFAQALGSGALRGDEFNSVAEQAPRLMQALADSIGVPVGALKEMAAQGLLTASVVTDALVQQLDTLRTEAQSLPETVGGAMTELSDRWNEAIGQADMQPLIEAIQQLGKTLSAPTVVDNLVTLAAALATLAGTVAEGASEFVDLGKRIAFIAANSAGLVTELDQIDQQIADLDKSIKGTGLSTTLDGLLYSKEELKAKRDALIAFRSAIVEQQTGLNAEFQFLNEVAASAAELARQQELDSQTKYIGALKKQQDLLVKNAAQGLKALAAEEKKATSELSKIRDERLKIEERYQEAIAGLSGAGPTSFGAANSLKVAARQALSEGDVEGAQAQAQAALKMIQELAAAGENTFGFQGFINELRDIELAANDLEQTNAENKIKAIQDEMLDLKVKAADLKDMPVSVKMDETALAAVKTAIEELANTRVIVQIGAQYDFNTPYTLQDPGPPPTFATGGQVRGPGSGTSDSILARLSNGEYVLRAAAVRQYGTALLDKMNGLQLPRFAEGGLVEAAMSAPGATPGRDLGHVTLSVEGQSFQLLADQENFTEVLRRQRVKFGSTRSRK